MYICMYVYIYVYMYVCIYVYICMYIPGLKWFRKSEFCVFISLKHQGFVDDFDYGDDQDDQQRIEEKKRQLEQEANRLNTTRLV